MINSLKRTKTKINSETKISLTKSCRIELPISITDFCEVLCTRHDTCTCIIIVGV